MIEIRDPELHSRKIKMIQPRVFYHKCKVCGYEFRNTPMWSWIDNWEWEGDAMRAYACTACVPDIVELFKHIQDYTPLEPRPEAGKKKQAGGREC